MRTGVGVGEDGKHSARCLCAAASALQALAGRHRLRPWPELPGGRYEMYRVVGDADGYLAAAADSRPA